MKTRLTVFTLAIFALIASLIAIRAHSFFRVSFSDKDFLVATTAYPDSEADNGTLERFDSIVLPEGASGRLLELAVAELAGALEARTGLRPGVGNAPPPLPQRFMHLALSREITGVSNITLMVTSEGSARQGWFFLSATSLRC
jgi:hypothetical protein